MSPRHVFYAPLLAIMISIQPAQAQDQKWYRGNTHTHTINSDGDAAPDTVVRWYREHGYDFVFITDHEYLTDVAPLNALVGGADRFLALPGQEVTQWGEDPKRSAAHVNALFPTSVIWPVGLRKCLGSGCGAYAPATMPLDQAFDTNIAAILKQGAVAQINHPNYRWSVKPTDLDNAPDRVLLEVWNGQGEINNLGGDDGKGDVRPSAEGYWDYLLSKGKIVWGVASDDSHEFGADADPHSAAAGQAWIMVRADALTPTAIRSALERGDFYASTGIELADIQTSKTELTVTIAEDRPGAARYTTRFIGQDGKVLATVAGTTASYRFARSETYVRASVIDSNGNRAWTQPVYLDQRRTALVPRKS